MDSSNEIDNTSEELNESTNFQKGGSVDEMDDDYMGNIDQDDRSVSDDEENPVGDESFGESLNESVDESVNEFANESVDDSKETPIKKNKGKQRLIPISDSENNNPEEINEQLKKLQNAQIKEKLKMMSQNYHKCNSKLGCETVKYEFIEPIKSGTWTVLKK
uniref:Uncharacterized protein n=1 Tax=viral metagenome TaxID=1070528 RepID=A0A6C0CKM8_9ZZZZ